MRGANMAEEHKVTDDDKREFEKLHRLTILVRKMKLIPGGPYWVICTMIVMGGLHIDQFSGWVLIILAVLMYAALD
jgi:hypothetical protein